MLIQIDTREKREAIGNIIREFNRAGVEYIRSKLYVGDYMNFDNPRLVIDRKKSIRELATNATSGRKRVEAELGRAKKAGIDVIFLIEESSIDGKPIQDYSDIMDWKPRTGQGTISGYRVYKTLAAWEYHFGARFEFCKRSQTGKRIIDLLGGGHG